MRISDVTAELVQLPAQPTFRWRDGLTGSEPEITGAVLRIHTDDGVIGEAYSRRGVIVADIVARCLRDEFIGQDPFAREHLWRRIWEVDCGETLPLYCLGLVDVALWDIAGKAAEMSVAALLGYCRTSVPAYASLVTYGSVEEFLEVVDQCIEAGYQAVKLHAWGDPRLDADLCTKVRAHVGDEFPLMYDGSAGFSLSEAEYVGHALSDSGYLWYEEPMREYSISAYRQLAERVTVPLLVGETSAGAHMNIADFISARSASYVRVSPHLKGGITGALRIAHLADSFLLNAEVHGSGIVQRHLTFAIPNTTYYESLVSGNPIRTEPGIENGTIHLPTAAGIGYGSY